MIDANAILAVLSALFTASVASLVGYVLAKRRFKHDQLWQEKNEAYKRVFVAVEAIRFWGEEISSEAHFLPTVDWFDGKSSSQFYAQALREVSKQAVIGELLLSPHFIIALNELVVVVFRKRHDAQEERREDPGYDSLAFGGHAAAVRDLVDQRLPELIRLARKDLRS